MVPTGPQHETVTPAGVDRSGTAPVHRGGGRYVCLSLADETDDRPEGDLTVHVRHQSIRTSNGAHRLAPASELERASRLRQAAEPNPQFPDRVTLNHSPILDTLLTGILECMMRR
jgi:hypothetical protein